MNRFSEEMKVIPRAAWVLAAAICIVPPLLVFPYAVVYSRHHMFGMAVPQMLIFLPILLFFFLYLLLVVDTSTEMRNGGGCVRCSGALLGFFIPNMIGIILYFILRTPLLRKCPHCGATANGAFAFCPSCGGALASACPSCRSAVEPGWRIARSVEQRCPLLERHNLSVLIL